MDFEITTPEDKVWVHIKIHAIMTSDLQDRLAKDLNVVAKATERSRFLVDLTEVRNMISTLDQYKFAYEEMPQYRLEQPMKLAGVNSSDDHSFNFSETVFRNAGYDFRLFKDTESAIQWLEEDEPAQEAPE